MSSLNRLITIAGFALLVSACATLGTEAVDSDAKSAPALSTPVAGVDPSAKTASAKSVEKSQSNAPKEAFAAAVEPQVKTESLLSEGIDLYDKGDYRNAIRKLSVAKDAAAGDMNVLQSSLKYLAFSYCVSGQRPLCKTQFASLLSIAPDFQLTRGEAGHPLWGPVFKQARLEATSVSASSAKSKK